MDKRAAEQYLTEIFGTRQGHVAVAYKDRDSSWQEGQFAWPVDKRKLIAWAEIHSDANVFICPALRRDAHTRKKGDMAPTQWLWADVDWQTVPADKLEDVQARIKELGTLVVLSGTGENVHIYVKLSRPVDHEQFIKLNTGLRDYLYADNKQADNSLLRLPGTTNWKTEKGKPVCRAGGVVRSKPLTPEALLKRRVFRDAKVIADAESSEWEFIEVEGLPRRVQALVSMPVAEAEARYGSRYRAVWGVTGELHKRQLGTDEIHSLMDKFPAALSKAADENGYDVHRDVDKRLAYDRAKGPIEEDTEVDEDAGDVFEEVSLEEMQVSLIGEGVEKELLRRSIRRAADQAEAMRGWVGPPNDISWSLTDGLKDPPKPVPHLIGGPEGEKGLAGAKHNVVLTAQYKYGKTKFVMGAVASALCDGEDFLGHFPVNVPEGGAVVGHWNCEMDPDEMLDDYIRPVGIKNTDNLHVANLRGYRINILTDLGRSWAVEWLKERRVRVWTIDSFARLARMSGVSEKDNDEVMSLLMALDEIKVEAGVDVLFLITHTGRAEMEEGKERARGATAIDDWADARWIMTKVDKARFLRVEGRGVSLGDSSLVYDEDTNRSVLGFGGKTEVREDTAKDAVVKIVNEQPGIVKTALLLALRGVGISNRAAVEPIQEAVAGGFIEIKEEHRRGNPSQCHYPAGSLKGTTRQHNATPQVVDTRGIGVRTRRRIIK